jgi:hypothetical protein
MRTIIVLSVTGIIAVAGLYNLFFLNEPAEATRFINTEPSAALGSSVLSADELRFLTAKLEEYQQGMYQQLQETRLQQARFSELLEDIEARLHSVEQSANSQVSRTSEVNSVDKTPKPPQVTDADMGQWIDENLYAGYQNDGLTSLATDQAIASLDKAPGVSLDDMQCADRFCRATFAHVNGEQPVIDNLFGEPPFVHEGFTVVQPDGRVALYFNQPGESLAELRSEVGDSLGYWESSSEESSGW